MFDRSDPDGTNPARGALTSQGRMEEVDQTPNPDDLIQTLAGPGFLAIPPATSFTATGVIGAMSL